ncbi:MAG: hypothetical protein JOZ69_14825 [Myxococcales bacterium]|nr:hypothetical protein [Myxococcales bacterium]
MRDLADLARSSAVVAAAVSAAFGAFVPRIACAQERADALVGRHRPVESPQHFAFELRVSPFKPDIDSDPKLGGKTPYGDIFGNSPQVLVAGEFDWQVARIPHVGTIGPGFGFGYTTMSGNAPFTMMHNGGTMSGETTGLQIFPFYLVGVLRADVLWREAHVPLVPYAKLGLGLAFWRASNTLGTSNFNGVEGLGHSWGSEVALGISLNLNVFDEYAARNLDESMGVNNTYLFAEWTRMDLSGLFFQHDPLRAGGTFATFGLSFEF